MIIVHTDMTSESSHCVRHSACRPVVVPDPNEVVSRVQIYSLYFHNVFRILLHFMQSPMFDEKPLPRLSPRMAEDFKWLPDDGASVRLKRIKRH